MRARPAKGRGRAFQQRLDEGDPFRQLVRARLRQSDILGAAVSSADAEHRASIRDVVERGDRGRADRGVPGDEIGDAERNARTPRDARDHRRRHPRVHGVSRRVGNADHGIAVAVGALGKLIAKIEGVGPEEETNLHLPLSTRHRVIAAARSLRVFAQTAA